MKEFKIKRDPVNADVINKWCCSLDNSNSFFSHDGYIHYDGAKVEVCKNDKYIEEISFTEFQELISYKSINESNYSIF